MIEPDTKSSYILIFKSMLLKETRGAGRARWLSGLGVSCALGAGAVSTEAPVWSSRDVSPRAASNCCAGWTRPQKAEG